MVFIWLAHDPEPRMTVYLMTSERSAAYQLTRSRSWKIMLKLMHSLAKMSDCQKDSYAQVCH